MARSEAAKIAKNSVALLASKITVMGFSFVFVVFAARMLGVEEFGKWALVRSFFEFALSLCAAGLNTVLIRDIAKNPEDTSRYLTASAILALAPLAIVSLGMYAIARVFDYTADTEVALYLAILALVPSVWSVMVEGAFVGRERAEYVGYVTLAENLFRTCLSFAILLLGFGFVALFVLLLISRILMLVAYLVMFHLKADRLDWSLDLGLMRRVFGTWQIFAVENWLANLFLGTSTILLSMFQGERSVGPYAATDRLLGWVGLFASSYTNAVFPHMSRLFGESKEGFQRIVDGSTKYMLAIVLIFGVLVTVFADKIILFLYTDAYAESIPIMQVVVWVTVLRFLNTFHSRVLFARGEQALSLGVAAIGLGVYLAFTLALVPSWAGLGMAWAKVVGVGAATFAYFWFVFGKEKSLEPVTSTGRVMLAGLGVGAVAVLLRGYSTGFALGASVALYPGLLFALGVMSTRDLQQVQKLTAMGMRKARRLLGQA